MFLSRYIDMAHTQRSPVMDWIQQATQLFNVPKPVHFTNYRHCCECAEHDETLSRTWKI
jgi:hypothetical protein